MANQILEWKDVKSFIRRRKKLFFIAFIITLFSSIVVALTLPSIFRADTTILIEEQQIPENLVQSTITSYAEERLNTIKRQVLSNDRLKEIIKDANLYPEIQVEEGMGSAVDAMLESIELEPESVGFTDPKTGKPMSMTIAVVLSYEGEDPKTVQEITNVLGQLFLEEDVKIREKITNATTNFLMAESESLKKQIQLLEKKITAFKAEHFGELPEHSSVNLETIGRLERELDQVEMQIRNFQEKKINLEGQRITVDPLLPIQIDGRNVARNPAEHLKYLRLQLISLQSALSDKHPDVIKIKREIEKLESQGGGSGDAREEIKRLDSLKVKLAGLKSRYGPKHPDVVKLTKEIKILERSIKNINRRSRTRMMAQEMPDNPMYINLTTQISSINTSIGNLMSDKQSIQEDLVKVRKRILNAPIVEKEYNELTRDYSVTKQKYNEILNKLMTANVAKGMEEGQHGQRFDIKSPAYLPTKPYKPNRIAIILLGFVLASGFGFGLAAIQEFFDHSIKNDKELAAVIGIPVLTVISNVKTRQEKIRGMYRGLVWVFAVFGFILIGAKIIDAYLMPVSELWNIILINAKNM